jgi:hypothetical protein
MRRWVVVDERARIALPQPTQAAATHLMLNRLKYSHPDTFRDFASWIDMMGAYALRQLNGVHIYAMPDLDYSIRIDGQMYFTASIEGGIGVYTDDDGCYPWFIGAQPAVDTSYCYNTSYFAVHSAIRGGRIH